jgi:hypothetical protein
MLKSAQIREKSNREIGDGLTQSLWQNSPRSNSVLRTERPKPTEPSWKSGRRAPNPAMDRCWAFFQQDDVTRQRWGACTGDSEVKLCTIDGGGHQWPGGFFLMPPP